jgi:hypothetical protein
MSAHYVEYPLQDGFVANWLVAGPQAITIAPGRFVKDDQAGAKSLTDFRAEVFRRHSMPKAGIGATPVERGPLDAGHFTIGKYTGSWSYYPCPADHAVDHSGYYAACHYLRSWAYVELVSERQQKLTLVITSDGPADLWAGEKHLGRAADEGHAARHTFTLSLGKGVTPLLVRFENVGMGHLPHSMALRLLDDNGEAAGGVHVRFRTLIEEVRRRNAFEQLSAAAFVERDVYAAEMPLVLRWPEGARAKSFVHVRLQTPDGRIYLAGESAGGPGDKLSMGHAMQLPVGPLHTTLMPNPNEVYLHHIRISRTLPIWSLGRQRYHDSVWGDLMARRREALLAASRLEATPFAQVARMALGAWADVDSKALTDAINSVQRREEGSHLHLLALLGMLYRWGEEAHFPADVRAPLAEAILGYRYWHEGAGFDLLDFHSESNALLFHTGELLAAQLFPDRLFGDGQSGDWHRTRAEGLIKAWTVRYGSQGMAAWNAPGAIDQAVVALTHLCDLAEAQEIFEMATVALDKLFFTLALNSWKGVWGAAGQRVPAGVVKSGLLQPTAPLSNLMWGAGIFNHHTAGVVSLSCCANYQMPLLFERIALENSDEFSMREQHAAGGPAANIVTHKTPDYMLSSLQDYHAGEPGHEELVWRATLGAEAVIFANHPGSSSEHEQRSPGYWAGNGRLPRVAQWKDALIALHQLPDDDLFGFTHAYFPTAAFDEYILRQGWAFVRVGFGYMALTNSQPLSLTSEGRYAQRELRAEGKSQLWVVQMGRSALDGTFATFQKKVLALPLRAGEETVEFTTLRGDTLRFGRQGPLLVNGEDVPLKGFPHYENPFTTTPLDSREMVITWGEEGLRLDFGGA